MPTSRIQRGPLPRPRVYIASPYGFAESSRGFIEQLKSVVGHAGFDPVNPWDLTSAREIERVKAITGHSAKVRAWRVLNRQIGKANRDAIDSCEYVLACLDGPDVDSGTASEIGYAYGAGKVVVGYRGDFRMSGENEGSTVNLQVQYWIEDSGGLIVRTLSGLRTALLKFKSLASAKMSR